MYVATKKTRIFYLELCRTFGGHAVFQTRNRLIAYLYLHFSYCKALLPSFFVNPTHLLLKNDDIILLAEGQEKNVNV